VHGIFTGTPTYTFPDENSRLGEMFGSLFDAHAPTLDANGNAK